MTPEQRIEAHRMLAEMNAMDMLHPLNKVVGEFFILGELRCYKIVEVTEERMADAYALYKTHGSDIPETAWREAGFAVREERTDDHEPKELTRLLHAAELIADGDAAYSSYQHDTETWDASKPHLYLNMNDIFAPAADGEAVTEDEVEAVYEIWQRNGFQGLVRWACGKRGIEYREDGNYWRKK